MKKFGSKLTVFIVMSSSVSLLVLSACLPCPPDSLVPPDWLENSCDPNGVEKPYDLSNFDEFEFGVRGTKRDEGIIYDAYITKQEDGQYLLQMTIVVSDDPQSNDQYTLEELPERTLTEQEAQRMRQVFSAVRITTTPDFQCCISHVWYNEVRWDDLETSSGPSCSDSEFDYMKRKAMAQIANFLESLRTTG